VSSRLALEKAAVGKGPNRDLIYELYRVLSAKGCTYTLDFREGQGIELNKYIQADYLGKYILLCITCQRHKGTFPAGCDRQGKF
jgi:hypothetical protein